MPNGSDRITSHSLQELEPSRAIDDPEIKAWLALGTKRKKKGGGKKKKGREKARCIVYIQVHFCWYYENFITSQFTNRKKKRCSAYQDLIFVFFSMQERRVIKVKNQQRRHLLMLQRIAVHSKNSSFESLPFCGLCLWALLVGMKCWVPTIPDCLVLVHKLTCNEFLSNNKNVLATNKKWLRMLCWQNFYSFSLILHLVGSSRMKKLEGERTYDSRNEVPSKYVGLLLYI